MFTYKSIYIYLLCVYNKALKSTGSTHIYDLCSGGGGPHKALLPELQKYVLAGEGGKKKIQMTLTDLYPHVSAWEEVR